MKQSSRVLIPTCLLIGLLSSNQAISDITIDIDLTTLSNTPEAAVAGALATLCPNLRNIEESGNLTTDQQELLDVCNGLDSANQTQTADAYHDLSARSVTAETTLMMYGPMAQPVTMVDNRLAALRKAAKNATNASLDFQINNQPLYANLSNDTGGGASADVQSSGRLSGFVTGLYTQSQQSETLTLAGFDGKTYGMVLGLDYRFTDSAFAGLAARYSQTDVDLNRNAGSLDGQDLNLTQYGTFYAQPQWYIDWTLHYGQGKFDLNRKLDFTVGGLTVNETAEGNTDASHYGGSLGSGFEVVTADGSVSQIYADFRYFKTNIDKYKETSAGGLNLNIDSQSIESFVGKFGAQISKAFSYNWGVLAPQFNFNYMYEFITDGEPINASFDADPLNTEFVFTTEKRDDSYFTLAAGLISLFPGGFTAYLQYETFFELENYSQSVWSLGARMEF